MDFEASPLPMRYLRTRITPSRLSKLECRSLVEKIVGKVRLWSTRSISFARQAQLINSLIFRMYSYWASIMILPQEVIDQINTICRSYLRGAPADYKRSPLISCRTTCNPNKQGGLGLKNLSVWNKASIAKLLWIIEKKKDVLWVRWVHG